MTIYVVFTNGCLLGASLTREGADELMAKQIEKICKTTHESEIQNDRCYDIKLTMLIVNEETKTLTFFSAAELRLALKGVAIVDVEVAGSKNKYYIQSIELVG